MLITPDFPSTIDSEAALEEAVVNSGRGDHAGAARLLEAALAQHAGHPDLWGTLARVRRRLGDLPGSAEALDQVMALLPDNPDVAAELALTRLALGQVDEALPAVQILEDRAPTRPGLAVKLAEGLAGANQPHPAEQVLRRSLIRHAGHGATLATLGRLLVTQARLDEAEPALRLALRAQPRRLDAHLALGVLQVQQGQVEEAEVHYRQALAIDPGSQAALAGMALVFERQGRIDDCLSLLRSHPELLRSDPQACNSFAMACKRAGTPAEALPWVQRMLKQAETPSSRSHLAYSLGMLHDALDQPAEAARAWHIAGQLRCGDYDPAAFTAQVDRTIATFTPEVFAELPRAEVDNSDIPLLVVGFPRSGTSLVEQILASHPQVHGGGERPWLERIAQRLPRLPGVQGSYPEAVPQLAGHQIDHLAQTYLDLLTGLDANARFIVDKLTQNLHYLGLAAALLPKTRVVWCVRDPRDACLSAWSMNFTDHWTWSTRPEWVAQRWIDEQRLAAHWMKTLPLPVHTVRYEDLVTDPDTEIRSLLDFAELPWDHACRDFHRTERVANTASYAQVRTPLYQSSVGRWERYAEALQPMLELLAPYLDTPVPRR